MRRLVFTQTHPITGASSDHEVVADSIAAAQSWLFSRGIGVLENGNFSELRINEEATPEKIAQFESIYGMPGVPARCWHCDNCKYVDDTRRIILAGMQRPHRTNLERTQDTEMWNAALQGSPCREWVKP